MKKIFTVFCILFVLPLGLFGCSSNSNNSGSHTSTNTQSAKSNSASTSEASSNTSSSKRAVKVRYEKMNLTTTLDHEYREEHLYKYVPGTVDQNKTYSWDNLNVSAKTKVYVDKKAVATFKDNDDNEYEHEEFYRIKLGSRQSNQQYWVNDDVLQNDHEDDYDD
ncbi:hypothetical protein [Lentilactobacillus sunkii]|jgi:uncharacterized protein YcfL|uniref:Lipoprotein n=2 Tax=Lentilactobacillus sunkii TaxID=481719 RepID=A0A0R1L7J1_9LACO|nr:hypothetical protein [Lentilactobacillus sunkii]KRK88849.1 hypothetical protein FD17_GL002110 [Lentilactobacillus sunkii DSM 19904]OFA09894.1 hypothetical protein LASUN_23760 [Lentilactobacillus sunkii]